MNLYRISTERFIVPITGWSLDFYISEVSASWKITEHRIQKTSFAAHCTNNSANFMRLMAAAVYANSPPLNSSLRLYAARL